MALPAARAAADVCLVCRRTALHLALSKRHTETMMALVAAGADVHCTDNDGCGPGRRIARPSACDCCRLRRADGGDLWLFRPLSLQRACA